MKEYTFQEITFIDKADFSIPKAIENFANEEEKRFNETFLNQKESQMEIPNYLLNKSFNQIGVSEDIETSETPSEEELNKDLVYIIEKDDLYDFIKTTFNDSPDVDITEAIDEYLLVNYGVNVETFDFTFDENTNKFTVRIL